MTTSTSAGLFQARLAHFARYLDAAPSTLWRRQQPVFIDDALLELGEEAAVVPRLEGVGVHVLRSAERHARVPP